MLPRLRRFQRAAQAQNYDPYYARDDYRYDDATATLRRRLRRSATPDDRYGRVRCESRDRRTEYCGVDIRGGVRLVRQLSDRRCVRGSTWGTDGRGIWVTDGCRAEFELAATRLRRHGRRVPLRVDRQPHPLLQRRHALRRADGAPAFAQILHRGPQLGHDPRQRVGEPRLPRRNSAPATVTTTSASTTAVLRLAYGFRARRRPRRLRAGCRSCAARASCVGVAAAACRRRQVGDAQSPAGGEAQRRQREVERLGAPVAQRRRRQVQRLRQRRRQPVGAGLRSRQTLSA